LFTTHRQNDEELETRGDPGGKAIRAPRLFQAHEIQGFACGAATGEAFGVGRWLEAGDVSNGNPYAIGSGKLTDAEGQAQETVEDLPR
jgi:hypothetical protein